MAEGDKLKLDIVTIERKVGEYDDVDLVLLPGIEGEMGVLPNHAPVLTALRPGVIMIRMGNQEELFAVGGGFVDVNPKKVTVLAQSAERSDEIDIERAEEARRRALEVMESEPEEGASLAAMRMLSLSEARMKLVRRRRSGTGGIPDRQG